MPICREGHNSATDDYCDECGAPIVTTERSGGVSSGAAETCPVCGTPRTGRFCEEDGYDFVLRPPVAAPAEPVSKPSVEPAAEPAPGPAAEPSAGPAAIAELTPPVRAEPPAPAARGWVAVVTADRDYFDAVIARNGPDAASITFPAVYPPRRIRLTEDQVLIGRHSASRGLQPHIDLTGPPEDPGVSHLHAVLQAAPDGSWSIVDPGSTNGTTINDDDRPIDVGVTVPLRPGDRIHVGAWTTITLKADPA
jgi:hypothetical protein